MRLRSLLFFAAGTLFTGLASAQPADLLKAKGCLMCHEVDKKKVGPAFQDVAVKYKGNKEAESKLAAALKEGKGHPVRISATDAELKSLVQYVLALK